MAHSGTTTRWQCCREARVCRIQSNEPNAEAFNPRTRTPAHPHTPRRARAVAVFQCEEPKTVLI
eukprot:1662449-Rhodomonas_salina.2